jgi:hypothetical protein
MFEMNPIKYKLAKNIMPDCVIFGYEIVSKTHISEETTNKILKMLNLVISDISNKWFIHFQEKSNSKYYGKVAIICDLKKFKAVAPKEIPTKLDFISLFYSRAFKWAGVDVEFVNCIQSPMGINEYETKELTKTFWKEAFVKS